MNAAQLLPVKNGELRILMPADIHSGYIDGLNDPVVNRYLDGVKRVTQTSSGVEEFVRQNLISSTSLLWGVWRNGERCHCGTVRLHGIDDHHHTAIMGACLFDKSAWGFGLGAASIQAVTEWAFGALTLRWIEAGVYESNIPSQKAFESAGYEWQYDVRGKYLLEGAPETVKVYAARKD